MTRGRQLSGIAAAALVVSHVASARQARHHEETSKGDNERGTTAAMDRRLALIEKEDRDGALRLVDGDGAAKPNPRRANEIARLTVEIQSRRAAGPLYDERIAARRADEAAASAPLTAAVLNINAELQAPALEAICDGIKGLVPHFTDLWVADVLRERMLDDKYSLPEGMTPLISGAVSVRKLLNALPPRFRPAGVDIEAIERAARREAFLIIRQIEENQS